MTAASVAPAGGRPAEAERIREAILEIAHAALNLDCQATATRIAHREALDKLLDVLRKLCPIEEEALRIWFCELIHAAGRRSLDDLTAEGPDHWDDRIGECLDHLTGIRRAGC